MDDDVGGIERLGEHRKLITAYYLNRRRASRAFSSCTVSLKVLCPLSLSPGSGKTGEKRGRSSTSSTSSSTYPRDEFTTRLGSTWNYVNELVYRLNRITGKLNALVVKTVRSNRCILIIIDAFLIILNRDSG